MKYEPPQYNYSFFDCVLAWSLAAMMGVTIAVCVVAIITSCQ